MSSPTDWDKFYQQNFSGTDDASDSSVMMTISSSTNNPHGSSTPPPPPPPPSSSSNLLLSPNNEGRISKPSSSSSSHARRRSRASRRTPTTLLNTDTTNFRAMVQQFTGGPNSPFASTPQPPSQSFGFSLGAPPGNRQDPRHHILNLNPNLNPNSSSQMFPPGYRLQYQPQGFTISTSNVNNIHAADADASSGDGFFQRLGGNPRQPLPPPPQPPSQSEGHDGFFIEMNNNNNASSSSNSNENRGNRFMF